MARLQANNGYYDWLPAILGDKCRFLDGVVSRAGFKVIRFVLKNVRARDALVLERRVVTRMCSVFLCVHSPQGGYFFCADFTDVAERLGLLKDVVSECAMLVLFP